MLFRERQQKLEKLTTTKKYIDEFQREQALWRQKKREEMEEENRKIIEFASIQQQREGERMARVQETEEKRAQRQNLVWKWFVNSPEPLNPPPSSHLLTVSS